MRYEASVIVFDSVTSALLQQFDADALQKNISRSEWLSIAIEAYLQNNGDATCHAADGAAITFEIEHYKNMMKQSEQQIHSCRVMLTSSHSPYLN